MTIHTDAATTAALVNKVFLFVNSGMMTTRNRYSHCEVTPQLENKRTWSK